MITFGLDQDPLVADIYVVKIKIMVADISLVKIRSIGHRHLRSQDQDQDHGRRNFLSKDQTHWSQTFM